MLCSGPKRGWSWRISASRRSPSVGADGAALGVLQQAIEGGDLVEAR